MPRPVIPKQPSLFISYLNVGKLLYASLILFIGESIFFSELFQTALEQNNPLETGLWLICFIFSFVHIFLVLMDGWSRFQNYKRIKDQFYIHGFDTRIAANYKGSKCQRMAAVVAATELGLHQEIHTFYRKMGIKWYHFIPVFMLEDPFFLVRRSFWSRTFLEKPYQAKFNFKRIFARNLIPN